MAGLLKEQEKNKHQTNEFNSYYNWRTRRWNDICNSLMVTSIAGKKHVWKSHL